MIWRNWNAADKTLLLAAVFFFFALCLRLEFPANLFSEGLLFVAEAALVGGIADWFAVTALFKKPLGFPYHTAILPRRRDAFVKASIIMVQKEFFSRRKVIHHIERLHLLPMLMDWLKDKATQEEAVHRLIHFLRDFLLGRSGETQARILTERLRQSLKQLPAAEFFAWLGRWLEQSGRDREILARLASLLAAKVAEPETKKAIEKLLDEYERERAKGPLALLMAGLAEALDLVNIEEAAALMQAELVNLLQELARPGSPVQQTVLAVFYEQAAKLGQSAEFNQMAEDIKGDIFDELPLAEVVKGTLGHLRAEFSPRSDGHSATDALPALRSKLWDMAGEEYGRILELTRQDEELKSQVEHFLFDLVARSALHAQSLVGVVVKKVLYRLTDEELNRLVYDKVEPDLLWIRMNGSIVGSAVGLVMFCLLLLAR